MLGVPDLAQNIFPVTLGQVQVHQDQVWDCRIRVSAFPANEGEGGVSIGQRDQFKSSILLVQSPPEKEDIRIVVFNDENPGRRNNRTLFHANPQRLIIAASVSDLYPGQRRPPMSPHYLTTCLALTIHRLGADPT
jgi:hypothetical protein